MKRIIIKHVIYSVVFFIALFSLNNFGQIVPYPQSDYITGITFNWTTYITLAPGSDNWTTTWADDDSQYSVWGDGGGFGGTNTIGRVSLGVARIEGPGSGHTGHNVYGGYNAENPAYIVGKSRGIICIGGVFYMWVGPGSFPEEFNEARLFTSTNHGATWMKNDTWTFLKSDKIIMPNFLQFGKNFTNARDNYSYIYAIRYVNDTLQIPGKIDLIRVDKSQILNRASYEFFKGFDLSGNPTWTSDLNLRQPVFEDANGVGRGTGISVIYNYGLNRYILIAEHGVSNVGNIGVFETPEPWGPWKTVYYKSGFGAGHVEQTSFYWNIPPKWLSSDGKNFIMIFTGHDTLDSWNTVEARFTITPLPVQLSEFNCSIIDKSVILKWTTATEINNYGFEVERKRVSSDVKESDWTKIGFVNGNGNCNSPKSYSYLDTKPIGGNVFAYRLKQVDNDGKFTYSDSLIVQILSNSFDLSQNYPNPFNPVTKIRYVVPTINGESNNLSSDVSVKLEVYDILGKLQATLVNERKFPGIYEVDFNGANLANGIYFYKYTSGNYTSIKKMILLK